MDVRGKHVLVFGLGLLGGGIASTRWLLKEGAFVRVTDMKDEKTLAPSLKKLSSHERLSFSLGGHRNEDILWADLIIVNPGVPKESPFLAFARLSKKPLWNDTALFFSRVSRPIVAVTGTRGKTTVTSWTAQLLSRKGRRIAPTGNTPENPLLSEIARKVSQQAPVVAELSSWQLELLPSAGRAPHIAVITNLYPDHLNRYRDIEEYADAKANIFRDQTTDHALILNADHPWTPYFLKKKPRARIFYTSLSPLKKGKNGACVIKDHIVFVRDGKKKILFSVHAFRRDRGEHNLMNLLQSVLAASLADPKVRITESRVRRLTAPRFRQEIVMKGRDLIVVNDSTATSPDGTIAAIRRFATQGDVVLITGGTDKELEHKELAKTVRTHIPKEHLILLQGSATTKLRRALGRWADGSQDMSTLSSCVARAFSIARVRQGKTAILFSPGAASFEKFKNEFDRGEQFNQLVRGRTYE